MGALTDIVKKYFEANQWEYEQSPENEGMFLAGVETDSADFDVLVVAEDQDNQLTCFCICPDEVPEDRRSEVAEYIIRVNNNLMIGVFDMDFDDGDVRVRSSINFADMQPTTDAVALLLHGAISSADIYYPGLQAVLDDEAAPEDALEDVLAELDDEDGYEEEEK